MGSKRHGKVTLGAEDSMQLCDRCGGGERLGVNCPECGGSGMVAVHGQSKQPSTQRLTPVSDAFSAPAGTGSTGSARGRKKAASKAIPHTGTTASAHES